jgi:hypothetical protein
MTIGGRRAIDFASIQGWAFRSGSLKKPAPSIFNPERSWFTLALCKNPSISTFCSDFQDRLYDFFPMSDHPTSAPPRSVTTAKEGDRKPLNWITSSNKL